jgi:hypothetical protein
MKIDLSSVGLVAKSKKYEKSDCWVCVDVMGWPCAQSTCHSNEEFIKKQYADERRLHDELLSRGEEVGLSCPLDCGGQIVVDGPLEYDMNSDEHGIGVRFMLQCTKCGANSWEPMRGDVTFAKAKKLGIKY